MNLRKQKSAGDLKGLQQEKPLSKSGVIGRIRSPRTSSVILTNSSDLVGSLNKGKERVGSVTLEKEEKSVLHKAISGFVLGRGSQASDDSK